MTIYNNNVLETIHVAEIHVYWNPSSPAGQAITSLTLGEVTIWSGNVNGSPAIFNSFIGNVSVSPNTNKFLRVTFEKNYKVNGIERLIIYFAEASCLPLDSNDPNQIQ